MNEKVRDLLRLYENTLSQQGIPRRQEVHNAHASEQKLGHVRWMIDKMLMEADRDGWSVRKVNRWLGFIQGVLWSEQQFSIPALRDQSRNLYDDPQPSKAPMAEPEVIRRVVKKK